jgi:hypothetical protein
MTQKITAVTNVVCWTFVIVAIVGELTKNLAQIKIGMYGIVVGLAIGLFGWVLKKVVR